MINTVITLILFQTIKQKKLDWKIGFFLFYLITWVNKNPKQKWNGCVCNVEARVFDLNPVFMCIFLFFYCLPNKYRP